MRLELYDLMSHFVRSEPANFRAIANINLSGFDGEISCYFQQDLFLTKGSSKALSESDRCRPGCCNAPARIEWIHARLREESSSQSGRRKPYRNPHCTPIPSRRRYRQRQGA